ncbi:MAG: hypothetical protein ABI947_06110 [Chloroflexota bacterium]
MPFTQEHMRTKRDKKILVAMTEKAPIWLVSEEYRPREDGLLFNLVYADPVSGWVNERYKYDAFNDVLYHMGQRRLQEEETLVYQEQEPYISAEVATRVPNEPAYRPSPPLPATPAQ